MIRKSAPSATTAARRIMCTFARGEYNEVHLLGAIAIVLGLALALAVDPVLHQTPEAGVRNVGVWQVARAWLTESVAHRPFRAG
jgi:hypothetical protein